MKKWKQLVVFAMILTMVMGMTSFAATTSSTTNDSTVTAPSLSGSTISGNTIVKERPTVPQTENNRELGLQVSDLSPEQKANLAEGLAEALGTLKETGFGKSEGDRLVVFNLTATSHKTGEAVIVSIDCSSLIKGLTITNKDNFRVLHYNGQTENWENLPTTAYNAETKVLNAEFKSFSPVCVVASEKGLENPAEPSIEDPSATPDGDKNPPTDPTTPTGPTDPTTPTEPTDPTTPTEPTDPTTPTEPTDPEKPSRPTVTSDGWHLRYDSMTADKYNELVLRWDAYVGGKVEVQYSATPENPDSFKRLTTTKKTTYKFKRMEVGVEYGFRIVPKSDPSKASQILYVTREVSEIKATTVTATAKSYNSVSVKWNKIPGVKRYAIYRTDMRNGDTEVFVKSGTKMTDKRLTPGVTYLYRVAPIRVTGMKSDIPTESRILSVATEESYARPELKAISGLKVSAVDSGTLKVSWRRVKGATRYTVDEVVMVNGVRTLVPVAGYDQPLNRTQVKISSLSANSEHTYVVTAYGGTDYTRAEKAGKTKIAK